MAAWCTSGAIRRVSSRLRRRYPRMREQRRPSHRDDDNDHRRDELNPDTSVTATRSGLPNNVVAQIAANGAASARKCSGDDPREGDPLDLLPHGTASACQRTRGDEPDADQRGRVTAPIAAARESDDQAGPTGEERDTVVAGPCLVRIPWVSHWYRVNPARDARSGIIGRRQLELRQRLWCCGRVGSRGADDAGFATGAAAGVARVGAVACDASGSCPGRAACCCRGALVVLPTSVAWDRLAEPQSERRSGSRLRRQASSVWQPSSWRRPSPASLRPPWLGWFHLL